MRSDELRSRLRAYVTKDSPLGPSDAALIKDVEVAAKLFDPHNRSFNTLLRRDLSVVIGRRGSGKTALLNSYKYRPYLDPISRPPGNLAFDFKAYDIVLEIVTHKQFEKMQELVARDPDTFRPVEAIVDDWGTLVMDYFLARLVFDEVSGDSKTQHLEAVRHYLAQDEDQYRQDVRRIVWGAPLWERLRDLVLHKSPARVLSHDDAIAEAVHHLARVKKRAVILFDSMDEYDVSNPTFTRILGALMRFISHFNARQDRIKIKLGLPSEIFPEVQHASANPLKDLVSFDQLKWTAMELAQIAAYRFRLFLWLYDPDFFEQLADLDLNDRSDLTSFWSRLFPPAHVNRYGQEEEPLTYIMRHTQLLPRQLLMILQRVIVGSARITGGYRQVKDEAITTSVESTEPLIAAEILHGFTRVYPLGEYLCRPVFANFPTVFSFEKLEDKWRKKARMVAESRLHDFGLTDFTDMLVRMGIVGVVAEEAERYYEGTFSYDSLAQLNIGDGLQLCLHPIFSRHFNAAGNEKRKAVMPRGVWLRSQENGT